MKQEQQKLWDLSQRIKHLSIHRIIGDANHAEVHMMGAIQHCMDLNGKDVIRVADLVREMRMPPPAISRGLRVLETKGYIERWGDPENRRTTMVRFTEEGTAEIKRQEKLIDLYFEKTFEKMGYEEMETFLHYLDQFVVSAEEALEEFTDTNSGKGDCPCER